MKRLTILLSTLVLAMSACDNEPDVVIAPAEPTFDQIVYQNALSVQEAAEAYAAEHGDFPMLPCDDLKALMPAAARTNPASGEPTEPVFCEPKAVGSVSYRVFAEYDEQSQWHVVGYYIVGRGIHQDFIVTNIADPAVHIAREQAVTDNYRAILDVLDHWLATNAGVYPSGLDDTDSDGRAFRDYLPGGQLLTNPYTGERTEPRYSVERPSLPGQINYAPYDADGNGTYDGFRLIAVGSYAPMWLYWIDRGIWLHQESTIGDSWDGNVCNP